MGVGRGFIARGLVVFERQSASKDRSGFAANAALLGGKSLGVGRDRRTNPHVDAAFIGIAKHNPQ
jgi:hypothetical protein